MGGRAYILCLYTYADYKSARLFFVGTSEELGFVRNPYSCKYFVSGYDFIVI